MKVAWTVEELLPHRPPMVWLEGVEDFDAAARALVATITPRRGDLPYDARLDGVPGWAAIEYMAQAAAALVGCRDRSQDPSRPPRPGLLLGTRRLELFTDRFAVAQTYRIRVGVEFEDSETASFGCQIEDAEGRVLATAALNAYRPDNPEKFIKELAVS